MRPLRCSGGLKLRSCSQPRWGWRGANGVAQALGVLGGLAAEWDLSASTGRPTLTQVRPDPPRCRPSFGQIWTTGELWSKSGELRSKSRVGFGQYRGELYRFRLGLRQPFRHIWPQASPKSDAQLRQIRTKSCRGAKVGRSMPGSGASDLSSLVASARSGAE